MTGLIQRLPSTLVLGTLATVFLITCRKQNTARVRLWVWSWALILLNLITVLLQDGSDFSNWLRALSDASLLMASVAFVISTTPLTKRSRERRQLILILGTPAIILSCVVGAGAGFAWISSIASALFFFGPIVFLASRRRRPSLPVLSVYAVLAVFGLLSIYGSIRGDAQFPIQVALIAMFGFAAVWFYRGVKRWTAGAFLTFVGFAGWSAVLAIAAIDQAMGRTLGDLFHVPQYLLAFGMILLSFEEEQVTAEVMRETERSLNQKLESFAEVTSRLLSGEDVRTLGSHIAQVVTKVTTFQRVVILLADEQQHMYVAGHEGFSEDDVRRVEEAVSKFSPHQWASFGEQGRLVGRTSFVFSNPSPTANSETHESSNPFWQWSDELLVPIRSPRGMYAGFISLVHPRELTRVNAAEVSKLELLANDLGVAIERAYLQRELVRSEKLAGVGQLVAGMAHELNNPLTAVLGYSEMLNELSDDPQVRQQASVIQRESLRMKRIIDNLVRFAKQDKPERSLLSINQTLDEVLKLWKSQAKKSGIQMDVQVEKDLPRIRFDEAQLKQVFLNLLNNAYEAVADSEEKRITVSAGMSHGTVSITVSDTGSGFQDPERVFDPFFTTKAVGKGTGLGLSVCYGIVKQHGGDIRAFNTKPHGAGVTMEVPVAQQELALTI